MKIRLENATAAQLRAFMLATWGVDTAANATVKSLKNKLEALEFKGEEFEISEEEVELATTDLKEGIWTPDHAVAALIEGGMPEPDARQLLNLAEKGRVAQKVAKATSRGEKVYGPGKESMYASISLHAGAGKEGGWDLQVAVNGRRKDIPRAIDWPLPTPFVEALDHTIRIVYEEVYISPELPRRHVPRAVHKYPFQVVAGPYEHGEYLRLAKIAEEELARRRGKITAPAQSPEAALAADMAMA